MHGKLKNMQQIISGIIQKHPEFNKAGLVWSSADLGGLLIVHEMGENLAAMGLTDDMCVVSFEMSSGVNLQGNRVRGNMGNDVNSQIGYGNQIFMGTGMGMNPHVYGNQESMSNGGQNDRYGGQMESAKQGYGDSVGSNGVQVELTPRTDTSISQPIMGNQDF